MVSVHLVFSSLLALQKREPVRMVGFTCGLPLTNSCQIVSLPLVPSKQPQERCPCEKKVPGGSGGQLLGRELVVPSLNPPVEQDLCCLKRNHQCILESEIQVSKQRKFWRVRWQKRTWTSELPGAHPCAVWQGLWPGIRMRMVNMGLI